MTGVSLDGGSKDVRSARGGLLRSLRRLRRLRWCLAVTAVLLAVATAGCRSRGAVQTTGDSGERGFPVAIEDAQHIKVRVEARPARIVSTAPAVTEIVFALGAGDRVVAVTDQCDYPSEVAGLPRIGGFWTPSVEKVIGARPDLVIGQRGNPPDFVETLRKSGVPVFTIDPKTLDDIYATIRDVARLVGDEGGGEELCARMATRLAAVSDAIADIPEQERRTAFLFLQVMPPWTAGAGTFQHDAILAAGGRNIASNSRGFSAYSVESLVAKDPDFLLLSTMEGDPERMKRDVLANASLRYLSAVRETRIVVLDADPLMRTGPRVVEAVEAMARAFYPKRLGDEAAVGGLRDG